MESSSIVMAAAEDTQRLHNHPAKLELDRITAVAAAELPQEFKTAVEQDAENGYPGLHGFFPTKGLTRYERIIEAHFASQIAADKEGTLRNYLELSKEDFGADSEGRYLNADLARDVYAPYRTMPELRPALERATIAPAGFLSMNLAWNHWLKNPGSRSEVIFTAGGMASGKTTTLKILLSPAEKAATSIYMDSVLGNYDRAVQMMQQVASAGLTPKFLFVYRPFEAAATGALKRLRDSGRPVRLEQLGAAHYDAQRVFLRLEANFGDRFDFDTTLNEGAVSDIKSTIGVDELIKRSYSKYDEGRESAEERDARSKTGPAAKNLRRAERTTQEGQNPPESPLRNFPEAEAKQMLRDSYSSIIESSHLDEWQKTNTVHGFLPEFGS